LAFRRAQPIDELLAVLLPHQRMHSQSGDFNPLEGPQALFSIGCMGMLALILQSPLQFFKNIKPYRKAIGRGD
jgi:hypothetical protein